MTINNPLDQARYYDEQHASLASPEMEQNIAFFQSQYLASLFNQYLPSSLKGNQRILEIGCGSGSLMAAMQELLPNCSFRGYDISNKSTSPGTIAMENGTTPSNREDHKDDGSILGLALSMPLSKYDSV
jgi:tRNA G46 methylase TrmB